MAAGSVLSCEQAHSCRKTSAEFCRTAGPGATKLLLMIPIRAIKLHPAGEGRDLMAGWLHGLEPGWGAVANRTVLW